MPDNQIQITLQMLSAADSFVQTFAAEHGISLIQENAQVDEQAAGSPAERQTKLVGLEASSVRASATSTV